MWGKKRWWMLCAVIMMSYLFFPFRVFAKQIPIPEVKIAKVRFKPTLSAYTEYHSNINLKNNDQKSSLIYRITPGLALQAPLFEAERTYVEVDADTAYVNAEDGDKTWTGHGRGLLRYNFSDLTSLGLSYDFTRGDLYGTSSGNSFDLQEAQVMIKHEFSPRLVISVGADQDKYDTHLKGQSELFTDYYHNVGNVLIGYQLTPLTSLAIAGSYGRRNYKDGKEKDYESFVTSLGVSQKLTPRIQLAANCGYTQRDYEYGDDAKEITYGSGLNVILSSFSTLSIDYSHGIQDTFYPKSQDTLNNSFATDEQVANLLDENYKYIITDRVGMNLAYRLTDKDTLDIGGAYTKSSSGQDLASLVPSLSSSLRGNLSERNYYGGAGYSHKLTSWMSCGLKGTYGVRTSNTREKYDYWTATGGLSISY